MSREKQPLIPQERMESIKQLPEFYQKYIIDVYFGALQFAEESFRDELLQILDLDIQTLQSQEDPQQLAFNEERENGFVSLTQKLEALLESDPSGEKLERWLAGSFNNIFKYKDDKVLFPRDFSSVRVVFARSATAAVVTRRDVTRPILVFDDEEQIQNIFDRFSGSESTNGMFVPIFGKGELPSYIAPGYAPLARAGILLARKGKESTLGHEIRHTIDPLVFHRTGFNEILSELFAFATQVYLRRDVLSRMLNHDSYVSQNIANEEKEDKKNAEQGYTKSSYFGIEEKTPEVHRLFVETALDTFFQDCSKMGVIKALRRLGKAPDLKSYFALGTQMKLAKLL